MPAWRARVFAAPVLPRELRAEDAYRFDPELLRDLRVSALLLTGSESPAILTEVEKAGSEALPNFCIVVMPGQGRVAMDTGTDLFTTEVLRFLEDP